MSASRSINDNWVWFKILRAFPNRFQTKNPDGVCVAVDDPSVEQIQRGAARSDRVIRLDKEAVEKALQGAAIGLDKYCWLQAALPRTDVAHDREFQTAFNGFYRVRRGSEWQSVFYGLMQRNKSKRQSFAEVLRELHAATGRVEASFASKLVASIDPGMPVIDAIVLKSLGLSLLRRGAIEARLEAIIELHNNLRKIFSDYLETKAGRQLVARFVEVYPDREITRVKMLDLVLWRSQ